MKLLIEIPEEQYRTLNAKSQNDVVAVVDDALLIKAIKNGKPLDEMLDAIKAEIEPKCDRINSLASVLPYTTHREIQELLCEIMNLCKAEGEEKRSKWKIDLS